SASSSSSSLRGRECGREGSDSLLTDQKRSSEGLPETGGLLHFGRGRTMAQAQDRPIRSGPSVVAETKIGNAVLIEQLRRRGVRFFAGVNGGGVVHVAKHMEPYTEL